MSLPSSDASTAARVRGLLADVIELAQVRFELFTVEAREELARLAGMAVMGALAVVFVSFGLIFLAIFLTVLLWDTHRLLALGIFTSLFLGGGLCCALSRTLCFGAVAGALCRKHAVGAEIWPAAEAFAMGAFQN